MRITVHRSAGPHNTWSPTAFDAALDKPIALQHSGIALGTAYLRRVTYTPNYRTAILVIEVAGDG